MIKFYNFALIYLQVYIHHNTSYTNHNIFPPPGGFGFHRCVTLTTPDTLDNVHDMQSILHALQVNIVTVTNFIDNILQLIEVQSIDFGENIAVLAGSH